MTIWFDMDGTIADLYGVENWLPMLIASDTTPYAMAKPLVKLSTLARTLNRLQAEGYRLGVISWLSKSGTPAYNAAVTATKYAWLKKHLPSVRFDEINIVPYGMNKNIFNKGNDILFDDEKPNRENWTGIAYDVDNIIENLKSLPALR
jgi:hypothetical protein